MDMKKLLNIVSGTKEKTQLTESSIVECGDMPPAPMTPPVTMNVSLNAQGIDQIKDLLGLMHRAEGEMTPPPMQMPMALPTPKSDDLGDIVKIAGLKNPEKEESYANEPEEEYGDMDDAVPNGDDLHKSKKMFKKAQDGDNPMAVESIRAMLDARYKQIKEGKEKPDFLDMDKDGDKKEPMKKALADKKKKGPVKESTCDCDCGKSPCEACGEDHHEVKEGWDDMIKAAKEKAKPQPNGGTGVKKGTRYGGAAQKDEPEAADKKSKK
jgi:hypothetical protein